MKPHGEFQRVGGDLKKFEEALHAFMKEMGFTTKHSSDSAADWPPPEGSLSVPFDPEVLRRDFQTLSGARVEQDSLEVLRSTSSRRPRIDFDNKVTLHVCSPGYCWHRGGLKKECKWGFGDEDSVKKCDGSRGLFGGKPCGPKFRLDRDPKSSRWLPEMPRNHPRRLCTVIDHWRLLGCNMDHQPFISLDDPVCPRLDLTFRCAEYMVGYSCKGNPRPDIALSLYQDTLDVVAQNDPGRTRRSLVKTLMCKSISQRHIPHQQAVFENSGAGSWFSSFSFQRVGMSLSRRVRSARAKDDAAGAAEPGEASLVVDQNIVDKYVKTVKHLQGVLGFDDSMKTDVLAAGGVEAVSVDAISLYNYASTGPQQKEAIGTYVPVVTGQGHLKPTWPLRPSWCLMQLRLFSPGFVWEGALYEDQTDGPTQETVAELLAFLGDGDCPRFLQADVQRCKTEHKEQQKKTRQGNNQEEENRDPLGADDSNSDSDDEDDPPSSFFELIAGRVGEDEVGNDSLRKPNFDILQLGNSDWVNYHRQGDGSALSVNLDTARAEWEQAVLDAKRNAGAAWAPPVTREHVLRANPEQQLVITAVLSTVKQIIEGGDAQPLHLIVAGTAGTGKSFVLKSLTYLVQKLFDTPDAARVAAPSGSAGAQVGGSTIHALLNLGLSSGAGRVSDATLSDLQVMCRSLKMIQLDERSMISAKLLGTVSSRLQQGFGMEDEAFGGLKILILYGDDGQLPPPAQSPLYSKTVREATEMGRLGRALYHSIQSAVYLEQMVRQQAVACRACPTSQDGNLPHHAPGALCDFLPKLLHRMRFGEVDETDWKWICHRHLEKIEARDPAEAERFRTGRTLWLVPTREAQHNKNLDALEELHVRLVTERGLGYAWACPIASENSGRLAKASFSDQSDFAGLPALVVLCRNAPVVMTTNVCQPFGLFNGATGIVRDLIFKEGDCPQTDGSVWPDVILVEMQGYRGPEFLPRHPQVVPVFPKEYSEKGSIRKMFPLKLGFCLTCHKAQGFTCGVGHDYERVVVNLGPESTETWGSGGSREMHAYVGQHWVMT